MADYAITIDDIRRAAGTIKGQVLRTPLVPSPRLSQLTGASVFVKHENMQPTGSFKERGAVTKLESLNADERRRGVIAMSAGNHAQAVAYHARRLGIPATIVMPESAPLVKAENTRSYGAKVILFGETLYESADRAREIAADEQLVFVHPYDDPKVMAGQGTIAIEMLDDMPDLDQLVVPIGGGGLISGIAIAAKAIKPDIEIIGVEAALYPSFQNAIRHEDRPIGGATLAEGIAVKTVGQLPLPDRSRPRVGDHPRRGAADRTGGERLCDLPADDGGRRGRRGPRRHAGPAGALQGQTRRAGALRRQHRRAHPRLGDGAGARTGRPHHLLPHHLQRQAGPARPRGDPAGSAGRQHSGGFPRPIVPRRARQRRFHRHHYRNSRQRTYIGGVPGPRG